MTGPAVSGAETGRPGHAEAQARRALAAAADALERGASPADAMAALAAAGPGADRGPAGEALCGVALDAGHRINTIWPSAWWEVVQEWFEQLTPIEAALAVADAAARLSVIEARAAAFEAAGRLP